MRDTRLEWSITSMASIFSLNSLSTKFISLSCFTTTITPFRALPYMSSRTCASPTPLPTPVAGPLGRTPLPLPQRTPASCLAMRQRWSPQPSPRSSLESLTHRWLLLHLCLDPCPSTLLSPPSPSTSRPRLMTTPSAVKQSALEEETRGILSTKDLCAHRDQAVAMLKYRGKAFAVETTTMVRK